MFFFVLLGVGLLKIGLVAWNKFQFNHYVGFVKRFPSSFLIVEKRLSGDASLPEWLAERYSNPVLIANKHQILMLDGVLDVMIVQTEFSTLYKFKKTKIIMWQYGLAKEKYNYGEWRSLASGILCYGDYSAKRFLKYAPSISVGNLSFESTCMEPLDEGLVSFLDNEKKKILYVPTWGDLSSVGMYLEYVCSNLSEKYCLIIKLHHNDISKFKNCEFVLSSSAYFLTGEYSVASLMSSVDVVISDYSGAIFDAVYFTKPLVLLNIHDKDLLASEKIDLASLECRRRSDIGVCVNDRKDLICAVDSVASLLDSRSNIGDLVDDLYNHKLHDSESIGSFLNDIVAGNLIKSRSQSSVEIAFRSKRSGERDISILASRLKYFVMRYVYKFFPMKISRVYKDEISDGLDLVIR